MISKDQEYWIWSGEPLPKGLSSGVGVECQSIGVSSLERDPFLDFARNPLLANTVRTEAVLRRDPLWVAASVTRW